MFIFGCHSCGLGLLLAVRIALVSSRPLLQREPWLIDASYCEIWMASPDERYSATTAPVYCLSDIFQYEGGLTGDAMKENINYYAVSCYQHAFTGCDVGFQDPAGMNTIQMDWCILSWPWNIAIIKSLDLSYGRLRCVDVVVSFGHLSKTSLDGKADCATLHERRTYYRPPKAGACHRKLRSVAKVTRYGMHCQSSIYPS